jgi:hypothetical protein
MTKCLKLLEKKNYDAIPTKSAAGSKQNLHQHEEKKGAFFRANCLHMTLEISGLTNFNAKNHRITSKISEQKYSQLQIQI